MRDIAYGRKMSGDRIGEFHFEVDLSEAALALEMIKHAGCETTDNR